MSAETLREHNDLPVTIIDGIQHFNNSSLFPVLSNAQRARLAKTRLYGMSPYDQTLYIDADTRVRSSLEAGFDALDDGWDFVVVPSSQQGEVILWHSLDEEREATLSETNPFPLQLQGGVFWFKRNDRTEAFFWEWYLSLIHI